MMNYQGRDDEGQVALVRAHTLFGESLSGDTQHASCSGCRDRRDRACAACGAPASIWTDAGDGRHAVAWCEACHHLLMSGRPANAQPLVYLPAERREAIA